MNSSVYQHFRPEEHQFIDHIYNWIDQLERQYCPQLTNFLNPREQYIIQSVVGHRDTMTLHFWGGYENSERKRALLLPAYFELSQSDFSIQAFEIDYPNQFGQLFHNQVMGALLNLGLDADKFGDIIKQDQRWQFLVDQQVSDFIRLELRKIGKWPVLAQAISSNQLIQAELYSLDKDIVVSSLRVDLLIGQAFNLSRAQTKKLVQADKVKLNWQKIKDGSMVVSEQDVVSVRSFGRVKLKQILNRTKKDKFVLAVSVLNNKR